MIKLMVVDYTESKSTEIKDAKDLTELFRQQRGKLIVVNEDQEITVENGKEVIEWIEMSMNHVNCYILVDHIIVKMLEGLGYKELGLLLRKMWDIPKL